MALTNRRIVNTWWPLAASWALMGLELPAVSAVIARLPGPEINLAAYGGVVFTISLLIEAPIIMLLAASTALSVNLEAFQTLRRYMVWMAGTLTALHILLAFTPLFDVVVVGWMGVPEAVIEPARVGLKIMTPWTFAIAFRRVYQGMLIRFEYSKVVGVGTAIRLITDAIVLGLGLYIGTIPGIIVGTSAVIAGVMVEAVYTYVRSRPVVRGPLTEAPTTGPPLTPGIFARFYIPLASTSVIFLFVQPVTTAALSRMPNALASLAVWPVVSGLVFMTRSLTIAYNEVVVALLGDEDDRQMLRRFANVLAIVTTIFLLLIAATPLSQFWFETVSGLNPLLAALAVSALWLALPVPGLSSFLHYYQGMLVNLRRTRGVTEAVALYLGVNTLVLSIGVLRGGMTGLYVGWIAVVLGHLAQVIWLRWRATRAWNESLTAGGGLAQAAAHLE